MAVSEKRVPRYLSIAAIVVSVLVTGWLWTAGQANPRLYVGNMAISHHNGYGGGASCYECHVPTGAFGTALTCATANCHGELLPDSTPAESLGLALRREKWQGLPDAEAKAKAYLEMHRRYRATSDKACWDCHREHDAAHEATDHAAALLPPPPRESRYISLARPAH